MHLNSLDYIIIVLLLLSFLSGWRQGMFGTLQGILGLVAGLVLAVVFYRPAASFLNEYLGLTPLLADWLQDVFPLAAFAGPAAPVNIPGLDSAYSNAGSALAGSLVLILSFLLIFFLVHLLAKGIARGLNQLFDGTILSGVNRTLGAGLMVIKTAVILAILLGLVSPSLALGAKMGIPAAAQAASFIRTSEIAGGLMQVFAWFKDWIAINV